jgi:hypothetical protein
MKVEIPLRPLAKAWQATQIAASDDEARPVLHRTALVEVFEDHGLRMVSTDSFVVSDLDQRALGLLKYVSKLYKKEQDEALLPQLMVSRQTEVIEDQLTFDGMEVETLRIAWQDHEEVVLRLVEEDFPAWRSMRLSRGLLESPGGDGPVDYATCSLLSVWHGGVTASAAAAM